MASGCCLFGKHFHERTGHHVKTAFGLRCRELCDQQLFADDEFEVGE